MGLARGLPESLHILTVEPLPDGRLLVRLEHLHETGPPVTVDLSVCKLKRSFESKMVYILCKRLYYVHFLSIHMR